MANFCTNCGRPLTDGVPCPCTQANAYTVDTVQNQTPPSPEPTAATSAPMQAAAPSLISDFTNFLKSYFRDPAQTVRQFTAARNSKLAIVWAVLFCLVSGLLLSVQMYTIFDPVDTMLKRAGNNIAMDISPVLQFGDGVLIGICALLLTILVLFLLIKLSRGMDSFASVALAVCYSTPYPTALFLLACIFVLFGWTVAALLVIGLALILWIVMVLFLHNEVYRQTFSGLTMVLSAILLLAMLSAQFTFSFQRIKHSIVSVEFNGYSLEEVVDDLSDQWDDMMEEYEMQDTNILAEFIEEAVYDLVW